MIYKSGTVSALPREDSTTNIDPSAPPPTIVCYMALLEMAGDNLDDNTGTADTTPVEHENTTPVRSWDIHALIMLTNYQAPIEDPNKPQNEDDQFKQEHIGVEEEATPPPPKRVSREFYVCLLCEDNDHALGLYPEHIGRGSNTLSMTQIGFIWS